MNVQMFDGRKRARVTQSGNQTILIHGKSGTTEVPIKVDDDGNVQISMDAVTVDLGQVTLHQGNPGVKAWPTNDANAKTALDAIAAKLVDTADATLHDKLDALLAYYKDAEDNTIHDKLDAMTTLLTTMSATLTSITEVVKVVDALALTTSSTRYIALPFSLDRYRDWDLFVTNTLDTECRVGFTGSPTSNTIDVVTESGEVVAYNPGMRYDEANYKVNGTMRDVRLSTLPMATKIPDPAEYKKLSTVIKHIAIRAAYPPTAGAISITLVGWY